MPQLFLKQLLRAAATLIAESRVPLMSVNYSGRTLLAPRRMSFVGVDLSLESLLCPDEQFAHRRSLSEACQIKVSGTRREAFLSKNAWLESANPNWRSRRVLRAGYISSSPIIVKWFLGEVPASVRNFFSMSPRS